MSRRVYTEGGDTEITADTMQLGEYAEIIAKGPYEGHIIVRAYNIFVSINNPSFTWHEPEFLVRRINQGEKIIIEV